jgi:hypothetical protein
MTKARAPSQGVSAKVQAPPFRKVGGSPTDPSPTHHVPQCGAVTAPPCASGVYQRGRPGPAPVVETECRPDLAMPSGMVCSERSAGACVIRSISTAYPQGRFPGCVSVRMDLLRNRSQARNIRRPAPTIPLFRVFDEISRHVRRSEVRWTAKQIWIKCGGDVTLDLGEPHAKVIHYRRGGSSNSGFERNGLLRQCGDGFGQHAAERSEKLLADS